MAVWKCGVPNVGLVLRANTNNFRANTNNWSTAPGAARRAAPAPRAAWVVTKWDYLNSRSAGRGRRDSPSWLTNPNPIRTQSGGYRTVDKLPGEAPAPLMTTRIIIVSTLMLALCSCSGQATASPGAVFEDFSGPAGSAPNPAYWSYITGTGVDDGVENYVTADAFLDGESHLAIQAVDTGNGYTSGGIQTKSKLNLGYGTITARIKMPSGQGLWPAFWLVGDGQGTTPWPEIDIIELPVSPKWVNRFELAINRIRRLFTAFATAAAIGGLVGSPAAVADDDPPPPPPAPEPAPADVPEIPREQHCVYIDIWIPCEEVPSPPPPDTPGTPHGP